MFVTKISVRIHLLILMLMYIHVCCTCCIYSQWHVWPVHCMAICKKLNILSRCWYECQDEIMIDVLLVLCCKQCWLNDVLYNKTEEFVHIFLLSVNKWYPMILFFIIHVHVPISYLHACLYQIWHETKYSYTYTYVHVFVFFPLENFWLIWRSHHDWWRATNFDLYTLHGIHGHWAVRDPHLPWHVPTLYKGHLRGPVTLTPVAKPVTTCAKELGLSRPGIQPQLPGCEVNALPLRHRSSWSTCILHLNISIDEHLMKIKIWRFW